MKEVQSAPEKLLVIDIKLTRGLVVALSCVLMLLVLLTCLTLAGDNASASGTEAAQAASTSMRHFYLTKDTYEGNEPTGSDGNGAGICATGYHFASMWELLDPSHLKYDTDLGFTRVDSGQGPPSGAGGWVRTGNVSSNSSTAGTGNCNNWTSNSVGEAGSKASFDYAWDTPGNFPGWDIYGDLCGSAIARVWCVED